jgi:prevent-host-death family protein
MTATDTRVRFGEIIRRVAEQEERIVVERAGRPRVVILSVATYEKMKLAEQREDWREALARAIKIGKKIKARRGGRPLTPPEEVIHQMRKEHDAQLDSLC